MPPSRSHQPIDAMPRETTNLGKVRNHLSVHSELLGRIVLLLERCIENVRDLRDVVDPMAPVVAGSGEVHGGNNLQRTIRRGRPACHFQCQRAVHES